MKSIVKAVAISTLLVGTSLTSLTAKAGVDRFVIKEVVGHTGMCVIAESSVSEDRFCYSNFDETIRTSVPMTVETKQRDELLFTFNNSMGDNCKVYSPKEIDMLFLTCGKK